jgi:P4 family phage/plasmid primase-like protien
MSTKNNASFDEYLKSHVANKGEQFTHTRIPDKDLKIYGGIYNICDEEHDNFLNNYFEKVFVKGQMEYMTEKQLIEDGPLLVDVDMRYSSEITERQHTHEHTLDLIMLYGDKILKYTDIDDGTTINVFVLEKKTVNTLDLKTKDGIHLIFGIKLHKGIQSLIRNDVINDIKNIWDDLPLENSWEEVFDEGVTKGYVNWQMYGSRKPGHDAYLIKKFYNLNLEDNSWSVEEENIDTFNTKKYLPLLCARYKKHPKAELKPEYKEVFEKECQGLGKQCKKVANNAKPKLKVINRNITSYGAIANEETLDRLIEELLESLSPAEYKIKETHQFTMSLPESYYGPGSYTKWIRVGWALANTNDRLFLTWLKFSSQPNCRNSLRGKNNKFDWSLVPELYEMWKGFEFENQDGLSNRSIMYWCKNDARIAYEKIRKETIDFYIEETITAATEFDLATVLYNLFKDRFVCVSIKNNSWYEYKNNRWFEIDSGNSLRLCISREMHNEYFCRTEHLTSRLQMIDQSEQLYEITKKKVSRIAEICCYLKKTQWKNNIMREARELFYDQDFIMKLDQNPYLLCFNNYVIDFKNKRHRRGQPDDYISKCTNIDYIKLDKNRHAETIKEINKFFEELFPVDELREYMWQHLASVLIGTTENQTFNIYTGSGRNGKSRLVDLMAKCLGDYKGTVPITLITQNRNSIGSTSSEIVQLMGTRYAVMQEPSKGDKINEGIMKEITGGDPIQGRALWKDTVTFIPQFKLVVCTNTLFDIKSNDDGTWRRIRVCDFQSKFLDNPYENEVEFPRSEYPYQFKLNKKLDEKFEEWAPVFMGMLVELAYEKQGNVKDCEMVMASSNQYREGQDYLTEFVKDRVVRKQGEKIKKTELSQTFKEWYVENYGRNVPKIKELHDYMEKRFGRHKNGWQNVAIVYDNEEAPIDELL